jgi:hypothetical protein
MEKVVKFLSNAKYNLTNNQKVIVQRKKLINHITPTKMLSVFVV